MQGKNVLRYTTWRCFSERAIRLREGYFHCMAQRDFPLHSTDLVGPISIEDLLGLLDHPDLLIRQFQNERRVSRLLQYMSLQAEQLNRASGGTFNPYQEQLELRGTMMQRDRAQYEYVVHELFNYIEARIYQGLNVIDLTNDERLTLFDDRMAKQIIHLNRTLEKQYQDMVDLERETAGHRFHGRTEWTGQY